MSFKKIDEKVKTTIAPKFQRAAELRQRIRIIIEELGKNKGVWGINKREEFKSRNLKVVRRRKYFTRHYEVFHDGDLVFHITDMDTVHLFLDGDWVDTLPDIYLDARIKKMNRTYGLTMTKEQLENGEESNPDTSH
jgi:hypothetical protein